jgi:hypothetical protein
MAENAQILIRAKDDTASAWASVQANASKAITGVMDLMPGLAGALSAAGLIAFAKQSLDAADHLNDLSKSTNISVENLSGLQLLARQTGTDMEGLAKGINRMSVEIGKDPEKFRQLGIAATDNVGAFKQFADVFNSLQDINQRNALSQAVFARSWAELAPALSEGGQKIGEIIEAGSKASGMTTELARKSDELNDKWAQLFHTGALGNAVLKEMIDPLTSITDQMLSANKASIGFGDMMARFFLIGGDAAKDPARSIDDIDKKLIALRATSAEFASMGTVQKLFSSDDIGVLQSQIALLEQERQGLVALDQVRHAAAANAMGGMAGNPGAADAAKRAAAFLDQKAMAEAMKKQWDLTQMLIDSENRWDASVKDHRDTVHKLEDAEFSANVHQLEFLQQQENAVQALDNTMREANIQDGLDTAQSLKDKELLETESYNTRLMNLDQYLASVQASNTTAANFRLALETRHQQTLLGIEMNKNEVVRSMQMSTWQAAGDLVQQFAGKSMAAAIAVIAINKGLSIAQTINATAVATMRAFADLGPIAGPIAAAEIQSLGAIQIGLIAATGIAQVASLGGGGASLGSPANPVNTTDSGFGAPFTPASATAPASSQTTIVNFTGTTDERKLLKRFVDMLNENSRDGGRILTT